MSPASKCWGWRGQCRQRVTATLSTREKGAATTDSDGTRHWDPPLHPESGGRWVHLSGVIFPCLESGDLECWTCRPVVRIKRWCIVGAPA